MNINESIIMGLFGILVKEVHDLTPTGDIGINSISDEVICRFIIKIVLRRRGIGNSNNILFDVPNRMLLYASISFINLFVYSIKVIWLQIME